MPLICQPLQGHSVEQVVNDNVCFSGLRLADYCAEGETLNVDILVGSDYYWNLVTGHTIRGTQGPTATHTKLGWYSQALFVTEILEVSKATILWKPTS